MYIVPHALIATVSLFAFAQNTTTAPTQQRARLVLLSAPRWGSTLLVEMLPTHGDVVMHGEPFHEQDLRASRKDGLARNVTVDDAAFRRRRERPQELLEALGRQHANRRVVGFKLFSKHLDWKRLDTFLDWATHLILLRRDDAFAQYVSICLAQASNVWAAYPGSAKHDHVVSVDAALFDTWSKHEAAFVETVERALAKAANPPGVLHLTYERDLCAPHARRNTMRRVERFILERWARAASFTPDPWHAVRPHNTRQTHHAVRRRAPPPPCPRLGVGALSARACVARPAEHRRFDVRRDAAGTLTARNLHSALYPTKRESARPRAPPLNRPTARSG